MLCLHDTPRSLNSQEARNVRVPCDTCRTTCHGREAVLPRRPWHLISHVAIFCCSEQKQTRQRLQNHAGRRHGGSDTLVCLVRWSADLLDQCLVPDEPQISCHHAVIAELVQRLRDTLTDLRRGHGPMAVGGRAERTETYVLGPHVCHMVTQTLA